MTGLALGLVLLSAVFHATWNLLAKRVQGGAAFLWLFAALSSLLYAPVAAWVGLRSASLQPPAIGMMIGSGALHVVYFLLLQRGYRQGDLSVVYPLARGTGPLLSTAVAVTVLGERPTELAILGALLVGVGAFLLSGSFKGRGFKGRDFKGRKSNSEHSTQPNRQAITYGLLTGGLIAAYTLWDKQAVSQFAVLPLLMDYGSNLCRVLLLTPIALRNWSEVKQNWQIYRREALGIACLSPLSYILVLTALAFTPVSYVAPTREISILLGVILGTQLLTEGQTARRLGAAAIMVSGVMLLILG
jgi:drug/metabolite transporter (DMT)-like permease